MKPTDAAPEQLLEAVLPLTGIDADQIDREVVINHIANAQNMAAAVFSVPVPKDTIDLAAVFTPAEVTQP